MHRVLHNSSNVRTPRCLFGIRSPRYPHGDTPDCDRPRADPLPPLQLPRAPARQPNRCINSTRSNNTCDAGGLVLGKHYVAMSHRYTNHMLLSQCVTASTADFTAATCQFIHYIVQHRYTLWHWTEPCHTDIHSPCNAVRQNNNNKRSK